METSYEFETRTERFQEALRARSIDVAVLLEPRDQLYLTGIGVKGAVVVPADDAPVHLVQLNIERAEEDSAIDDVRPSVGTKTIIDVITTISDEAGPTIGVEKDVLPVQTYEKLQAALPTQTVLVDVSPSILGIRRRKSESELERIERAAKISRTTLERVSGEFEENISEIEFKSMLQRVKRREGAEDGMWSRVWDQHLDFGILASGPNTGVISGHWVTMTGNGPSAAQPYGAGHRKIRNGDVVVVDHGTVYEGYHSDEARTYVVGGPTDEQQNVHDVLVDVLEAAEATIAPGNHVADVYDAAYSVVSETPYAAEFMGLDQVGFEYLGHMVGLDIDEKPLITPWEDAGIEPGMVFAVEPKIIFKGEEGFTLEDTIVATENGSRRLTQTPRRLFSL